MLASGRDKKLKNSNQSGITMIEMLIVIAVIGILSTLVFISVKKVQNQAKDTRRVNDIRELGAALERYANDNNGIYPPEAEVKPGQPLVSPSKTVTYMPAIPSNPKPRNEGACGDKEYKYTRTSNNQSYIIQYCLVNGVSGIAKGDCVAYPGAVCIHQTENGCRCDDIKKVCCGYCSVGSVCGGGNLFVKNFRINNDIFDLIAATSGCATTTIDEPSCQGDDQAGLPWYSSTLGGLETKVVSVNDGLDNTNSLEEMYTSNIQFPVAHYCASLTSNGFIDWYLPSLDEMTNLMTAGLARPSQFNLRMSNSDKYWTSTEFGQSMAYTVFKDGDGSSTKNNLDIYFRCIRR